MRHVFLETSWLVAIAAPAQRTPAAVELLNSAANGCIRIYIPACCIGEAKKTIRLKYQPKEADRLGKFVQWAVEQNILDHDTAQSARTMLSKFQGRVKSELEGLNDKLRDISNAAGVEVLPLDGTVLDMSLELHFTEIDLSEFDRAVLAAVLVKARSLRDGGEVDVSFCTIDSDLRPWDRKSRIRPELNELYDDAGVRVYPDFR